MSKQFSFYHPIYNDTEKININLISIEKPAFVHIIRAKMFKSHDTFSLWRNAEFIPTRYESFDTFYLVNNLMRASPVYVLIIK